jgi:uncharacterized protein YacL
MAWFILIRLAFLIGVSSSAAAIQPLPWGWAANAAFGAVLAAAAIALEWRMRDASVPRLLGAVLGAVLGVLFASLLGKAMGEGGDARWAFVHRAIDLTFPYLGVMIGVRRGEWLEPSRLVAMFRAAAPQRRHKILDTSVIIDGRVADICEAGFLDGTLVVPQFVLKELQQIADSGDTMRRNRGRRGLDILQKIQKMTGVEVTVSDLDFPEVRDVDLKLIELARALQGKLVTNDFNLNKVAQLRGIGVLNINELANAMKPVVLPGEVMKVFILKEGKEYNQGVAYLDDGTMVVVDNARRMISKTIDIVVTSVLQTTAGKMIFGRHIEAGAVPPAPGSDREDAKNRSRPAPPPQPPA